MADLTYVGIGVSLFAEVSKFSTYGVLLKISFGKM